MEPYKRVEEAKLYVYGLPFEEKCNSFKDVHYTAILFKWIISGYYARFMFGFLHITMVSKELVSSMVINI